MGGHSHTLSIVDNINKMKKKIKNEEFSLLVCYHHQLQDGEDEEKGNTVPYVGGYKKATKLKRSK